MGSLSRSAKRAAMAALTLGVLLGSSSCLTSVNEGLNINNMNVTVNIPKALAPTPAGIGVVYVGLFSAVQMYTFTNGGGSFAAALPFADLNPGTSFGETFPYAGTSIGDYLTRDARLVCAQAFDRADPVDDGNGNWAFQAPLLQFPFYPGARLWAFADDAAGGPGTYHPTCGQSLGRQDAYGIEVQMLSVAPSALYSSAFDISMAPSNVNASDPVPGTTSRPMYSGGADAGGYSPDVFEYLIDAAGTYWVVYRYKSLSTATSGSLVVTVLPPLGDHPPSPTAAGSYQPQRIYRANGEAQIFYGSQAYDVLNLPTKYVMHGDLITSTAAAITLSSPADTTITLDTRIP